MIWEESGSKTQTVLCSQGVQEQSSHPHLCLVLEPQSREQVLVLWARFHRELQAPKPVQLLAVWGCVPVASLRGMGHTLLHAEKKGAGFISTSHQTEFYKHIVPISGQSVSSCYPVGLVRSPEVTLEVSMCQWPSSLQIQIIYTGAVSSQSQDPFSRE